MRIDAHQHFWAYNESEYGWIDESMQPLRRDFLPAHLKPLVDAAGIDGCVAVQARQSLEETRWLLELAAREPFVAGVVGWLDLQSESVRDDFELFAGVSKLVGVRHIVQSEPDDRFLLRPAFCRGVSLLEDLDLTYDVLIYPKHLAVAAEFVGRFRRQRFVIDHLAKPDVRGGELKAWERGIQRLAEYPNVVCKLSGLVTEADWVRWTPAQLRPYIDVVFDCFGADRLMAGSDWPVCTVAGDYQRVMSVWTDYLRERSPADRDAVLGGTAERIYDLRKKRA